MEKSQPSGASVLAFKKATGAAAPRQTSRGEPSSSVLGCVTALFDDLGALRNKPLARLVIIQRQQETEVFFAVKSGKFDRVLTFAGPVPSHELAKLSSSLGHVPPARTVLRIGADRVIRKVISLPSSALEFLPSIVRNKVESISPWQPADLLWGYRRVDTAAAGDSITIEIAMTGNDPVKLLISELKHAGIDVGSVEFGDNAEPGNAISVMLPTQAGPGRTSRPLRFAAIAISAIALAATMVGALHAWRAQSDLQSTEFALQKLEVALEKNTATAGQATPFAVAATLASRKQREVPLVAVLKELTQSIPDSTWLQSVTYADGRVVINGKGGPASEIISVLEASPIMQDVNFAAATQRDAGENQDSFSISATVTPAKGGQ